MSGKENLQEKWTATQSPDTTKTEGLIENTQDQAGKVLNEVKQIEELILSIDLGKLPREYLWIIQTKLADDVLFLHFLGIGKDFPEDWKELSEMDAELLQAYIKGEPPFFVAYSKDMKSAVKEVDMKGIKYKLEYFLTIEEPRILTSDELYYLRFEINTFEVLSLSPDKLERLRKLIAMQDKNELFPFGKMGEKSRYSEGIEGPGGKRCHVWISPENLFLKSNKR